MSDRLEYRIIGAYDSETSNITRNNLKQAFPVLHQIGIIQGGASVDELAADNVESLVKVSTFRHVFEVTALFDSIAAHDFGFVPVIACHNLGFDMYPLSVWLSASNVRVLAKSSRKPITFTLLDDDMKTPRLVIWDTAVFSQKPLSMMGHECGFEKATGDWDYSLIRTPYTPISADEMGYAKRDIFSLLAWLGYWCRMNPDIDPGMLGLNVVTKTGVIRAKRRLRFDQLKGKGNRYNVGRYWHYLNKKELPKSDDELFTMHAATRGGFTFCASRWAGVPITSECGYFVAGFDATSQHPAQMVSKRYPVGFHETGAECLTRAFKVIASYSVDDVLGDLSKPFPLAFYGCFEFANLRPKAGSIFEREGVLPLASARLSRAFDYDSANEDGELFKDSAFSRGYHDSAINPVIEFGKLVSADRARLYITELTAWEISQAYDFDGVKVLGGYMASRFVRPTDMAVISVMQFYKAKDEFKKSREHYYSHSTIKNGAELRALGFPSALVADMEGGTMSADDVEFLYLGTKADLNGLFGIECTSEFRKDCVITPEGIGYIGEDGIHNAPKNPKAWYQFGQRIVGWSRVAQMLVMRLCEPYIKGIINGDTDSVKFLVDDAGLEGMRGALARYAEAIDRAKADTCARVKRAYPRQYDELKGIGHYQLEFEAGYFCASWNKAYCMVDEKGRIRFTLAGITTSRDGAPIDFNRMAQARLDAGEPFEDVVSDLLGYNLIISPDLTGQNQRVVPKWGSYFSETVTDYRGDAFNVNEPAALALFPLAKSVNACEVAENAANMRIAARNNPRIVAQMRIATSEGVYYL